MKLSDYVINFAAKLGVKHIFLLPGGGCMHLLDSLGRCSEIEYVCNLHEQACAIAADAYGQYTNNLGVALVTTGPGGTNAITGVVAAWIDSTPCLFISGQVKRSDLMSNSGLRQKGYQEVDIIKLVKSVTKYAITIQDPLSIKYHLEKAIYLASNPRTGPVWIDIPLYIQSSSIDESKLSNFDPNEIDVSFDFHLLKKQAKNVIELLNISERPVILAGNGIRLSKAQKDFLHLIDILKVPVLTTWKTIDLLQDDHWLFVGRPGCVGQRGANFSQQNSDLILIIGARLDNGQIGYNQEYFARAAKKVIVDIDPAELNKMAIPIDIKIRADAKIFIKELINQIKKTKDYSKWLDLCKEWQSRYPVILQKYWEETEYVNPYILIEILSDELTENDLLISCSSGTASEITMQAFKVKNGMRILNSPGLGAMGFGIPASIGGCLASQRKRTVCIDGDGGFQLNVQELETVKRLNLPIKFFVFNNQGYASIRVTQRNYFAGNYVASDCNSGLTLPDIVKIANAYGINAISIKDHKNIKNKVREVLNYEGPYICEVMVSPDQVASPRISSKQKDDGSMVSSPLEDLWPFLDRSEFLANMLVPPVNYD